MFYRIVRSTYNWSFIFAGVFLAVILVHSSAVLGAADNWIDGSGNWSTAANWSTGVPNASSLGVNITSTDGVNRTITYDYTGSPVTVPHIILDNVGGTNTLSMPGHVLTTTSLVLGQGGGGAVIQSGGTFNVNGGVQVGQTSTGSFTISGSGTSFSVSTGNNLEVGVDGTGTFTENGGSVSVLGGALLVGEQPVGLGVYALSSGSLAVAQVEYIGDAATGNSFSSGGTFNQTGGSNSAAEIDVGVGAAAKGIYTLSSGSLTTSAYGVAVGGGSGGPGGTGIFNVSGGTLTTGLLEIFNTSGSSINFSGGSINATALNFNGAPSLFHWTGGTLNMPSSIAWDSGASPTSTSGAFGNSLTLGTLQTLAIVGDEALGGNSTFALTVGTGGNNTVSGNLTVNTGSQLYLSGGTLSVNNLIVNGTFNWTAGTLNINGLQTTTIGAGGPLGSTFTLGSGQTLNLYNSATVNSGSVLTINGGNLTGYSMINNGNVMLNSGGLTVYALFNQAGSLLVVGQGTLANIQGPGSNAGEIELAGDGATLFNSQGYSINNTGLIHGDGVIAMNVSNSTGEIRAEDGKRLKITGGLGTNYGKINLQGGTLELTYPFTNGAGSGQIEGRGTLIVGGTGLTNNGNIAFSAGISDVFGDVHNSTGSASQGITVSGDANVTFWDDVTNGVNASDPTLFKVSSGSIATFFGTYSGTGVSGTGNVYYEADISPGFSPASVNYGGNVTLDSTALLKIELGGTTVGSQYDKMNVAGQLSLGGTLDVVLINGFTPSAGQSFDLLDWGSLSGKFSSLVLPSLNNGPLGWDTSKLYTTGVLTVTNTVPGDFNRDGHVDAADILPAMKALTNPAAYELQYGVSPTTLQIIGDVNGDTKFTNADLQALLNLLQSGGGSSDPVPEPASIALLGLGALAIVFCRLSR